MLYLIWIEADVLYSINFEILTKAFTDNLEEVCRVSISLKSLKSFIAWHLGSGQRCKPMECVPEVCEEVTFTHVEHDSICIFSCRFNWCTMAGLLVHHLYSSTGIQICCQTMILHLQHLELYSRRLVVGFLQSRS